MDNAIAYKNLFLIAKLADVIVVEYYVQKQRNVPEKNNFQVYDVETF